MGRGLFTGMVLACALGLASTSEAQEANGNAIRVFLDCDFFCDFDHFRRVVPYVDYMRDRQDAQVHVLVTTQGTGGGLEFTFHFMGLREYEGRADTLGYSSSSTDTETERRDGMVRTFTMGLMRYLVGTPLASRITIGYEPPSEEAAAAANAQPESDPWNFWVFRIGGGGSFSGQSQSSRASINGSVSANRTTEEWKIFFFGSGRYTRNRTDLNDVPSIISIDKNFTFGHVELINSITDHWSVGFVTDASQSTFTNRDLRWSFEPALEYNIFPYAESTRRQMTFLYKIGLAYLNYEETTVFLRDAETRLVSSLEAAYEVRQPWGSANVSVEASAFLHDIEKHRLEISGGANFRIIRGLDFGIFGNIARIKDQIHIPGGGISDEDRLLRRRQTETDFRYFVNFNISYRFGSIFNNVVNPRMDRL